MKTKLFAFLVLLIFFTEGQGQAFPVPGDAFPDISLTDALTPTQQDYLGLKNQGDPKLSGINSRFVLIEIFSMYCPHCQREAPKVNSLHDLLLKSPHRDIVKLIGVGAGNSPFEIAFFQKKYSIPFPLFSDPDFTRHKATGATGTPHFFLVEIAPNRSLKTILSHTGPFDVPEDFLREVLAAAGLK